MECSEDSPLSNICIDLLPKTLFLYLGDLETHQSGKNSITKFFTVSDTFITLKKVVETHLCTKKLLSECANSDVKMKKLVINVFF